ncbi:tetratricopeptide repeat protein [Kitasatospora sp. NBC_00374]|uniref:tetratricopeptide repeat protein n=1 Tax=Kitasatospora sp. NBC_00374 TaxID=2975964 RepID=UPI0030DE4A8F
MPPGHSTQAQQALRDFARQLKGLRIDAGNPTGPQLVKTAGGVLNTSVISELLEGKNGTFRVPSWDKVAAFFSACKAHSEGEGFPLEEPLGDIRHWRKLHGVLVKKVDKFDDTSERATAGLSSGPASAGQVPEPAGPVLPPIAPPRAVPAGFTGRDEDMEDLLALLDPSSGAGASPAGAVVVASVLGMGGMGKTTLGLAAGYQAVKRGLFTGVLFLDLHGYDETSLDAGQALDTALRGLGTDPEQIPPDTDQRAALYRAQLAARTRAGERVLVLADNASSAGQVEHLLPAGGPHRLLVTSRDDFAAVLGARLVDLDVLAPERAVELMDTALHITLSKDGRIGADPVGAARVAELCGYLPLALQIATAQLVAERSLKPGRLAEYLEDLGERLDLLDDGERAVRTVLERSYGRLAPTLAELFRLLAVNPGPDLSTETAAAFTGVTKLKDVRARLIALSKASLIRQDPDTGRWRMHDLVRAYAGEQASRHPAHTAIALRRLLDHYTLAAQDAATHVDPRTANDSPARRFSGRADAVAWLDAEHANLVAAVRTAYVAGHHDIAQDLPSCIGTYLGLRRRLENHVEVAEIALRASRDSRDLGGEADAWNNLGAALADLRRFEEAENAHRTALTQYQDLGDHHGTATAWNNLGSALQALRRYEEAEKAHRTALTQYQDLGDHHHEAIARDNLGLVLGELRRFEEAEKAHRTALTQYQDLGSHHSAAIARDNLGGALRKLRRYEEAEKAHRTALTQFQDLGDHHSAAIVRDNLGGALRKLGRFEEAEKAHRTALTQFQDLGDHHSAAIVWTNLGFVLQELERFEEAEQAHRTALTQHQALGDHHGEAMAWNNLGTTLRKAGEAVRAVEAGERAVALFEGLDDQRRLGEALDELADSLLAAGRPAVEVRAAREVSAAAYRRAGAEDEAMKVLEKANE